tara:strand:- start:11774 stop:13600 length:1827 start_codon:yes stop_codon:yes gene_type:complete
LFGVFLLMIVSAFLEMLNIGLFLPLMHVLLNREGESNAVIDFISGLGLDLLSIGTTPFGLIAGVLITVFVIKNIFIIFAIYLQARFISDLRAFFTVRLVEGYARRRYEEHLSVNSAHAVHDISQTAPSVVGSILQSGIGILMEILLASGALAALIVMDLGSALIAGGFVVAALTLYYLAIRRKVYELSGKALSFSRLQSRFGHFFLGAVKESMVLRRGDYFVSRIRLVANDLAKINSGLSVIAQLPRIYGEIAIVGAIVLVTAHIIDRQGSAEAALPLLAVFVAAAFRVLPSANRITHYFSSLRQTAPLLESIYPDLEKAARHQDYESEVQAIRDQDSEQIVLSQNITIQNVSYRYPNAKDWTLRDIDITVNKGEAVAFVGRTGAGKSTIIDIVLGLLPPTEGRILIDGEIVEASPNFWRGRIGYVPQSIYLMDDTLRRNIAIGIPDNEIDDKRLAEVICLAQLEDVLSSLSNGLDSEIGERGIRLSGGQRQRIGIARALYNDPEVLVLDEATSALDNSTERDIEKAIEELAGRKTVFIIAHRLSTVRRCDKLFFIDGGKILGEGNFQTLIATCQPFARLVEIAGDKDVLYEAGNEKVAHSNGTVAKN